MKKILNRIIVSAMSIFTVYKVHGNVTSTDPFPGKPMLSTLARLCKEIHTDEHVPFGILLEERLEEVTRLVHRVSLEARPCIRIANSVYALVQQYTQKIDDLYGCATGAPRKKGCVDFMTEERSSCRTALLHNHVALEKLVNSLFFAETRIAQRSRTTLDSSSYDDYDRCLDYLQAARKILQKRLDLVQQLAKSVDLLD